MKKININWENVENSTWYRALQKYGYAFCVLGASNIGASITKRLGGGKNAQAAGAVAGGLGYCLLQVKLDDIQQRLEAKASDALQAWLKGMENSEDDVEDWGFLKDAAATAVAYGTVENIKAQSKAEEA